MMRKNFLIRQAIPVFRLVKRGQKAREEVKITILERQTPLTQFDYMGGVKWIY